LKILYYGLVCLISIVLLIFSLIDLGTTIFQRILITDKEYLNSHHWVYNNCFLKDKKECLLIQRNYEFKKSLIRNLITILITLPIFLYHFKKFEKN